MLSAKLGNIFYNFHHKFFWFGQNTIFHGPGQLAFSRPAQISLHFHPATHALQNYNNQYTSLQSNIITSIIIFRSTKFNLFHSINTLQELIKIIQKNSKSILKL
jgi:hypothetical protein